MKIRLKVDLHDGHGPRHVTTNLFMITEWEKQERRKLSDGLGFGATDMAFWAHFLLKRELPDIPKTYSEWLEQNPDIDIEVEGDETDPTPTDAATTEGN